MAAHQASNLNKNAVDLLLTAETAAIKALDESGLSRRLCARRCEAAAREATLAQMPTAAEIESGAHLRVPVDVNAMLTTELAEFAKLRTANDLDGLITRYQLRESGCFAQIAQNLLFQKPSHYADAVVAKLEHDAAFMASMKKLVEPLSSTVNAP